MGVDGARSKGCREKPRREPHQAAHGVPAEAFRRKLITGAVMALLFYSWGYQIFNDIGVAGDHRPGFWGFYITNFVFWIGISHAGTLISAILRVTQAELAYVR